jgi:hypothetical protein
LLGCASAQLRFFVASEMPVTVTDGERAPSVELENENDEEEEDEDEEEPDVKWEEPDLDGWMEEEDDDDEDEEL